MSALDRGLVLLETLAEAERPVSLTEVAARTGIPIPSAHRLLQVLVRRGYASRQEPHLYASGLRVLALAGRMRLTLDYARIARPWMFELQRALPETVHFAILRGHHAVYVEKLEGRRAYQMGSVIGMPLDLHVTAIGKCILAFLPPESRDHLLGYGALPRHTPQTITTPEALVRELSLVRARGYAIDDEEDEEDVRCVGAPVFDSRGEVIGGISLSAPAFALNANDAHALAPSVIKAANGVSHDLGAPPDVLISALAPHVSNELQTTEELHTRRTP